MVAGCPDLLPGESTSQYCARLPRRRHPALVRGTVLALPRTGLIVVPYARRRDGWDVIVVGGRSSVYKPGCFDLYVSDQEIATAIAVDVDEAPLRDEPAVPEPSRRWALGPRQGEFLQGP